MEHCRSSHLPFPYADCTVAQGENTTTSLTDPFVSKIQITTPLKKATLILAMGLGFIAGCAQPLATHEKTTPSGLTCHISVPEHFNSSTHRLALVLENESVQPIRVCTACGSAHRSHKWNPKTGVLEVEVWLIPGGWEGDHGPFTTQDIPRSFTTLRPGESMDLPLKVWPDPNSTVRVTAHYAVQPGYGNWASQPEFQKLDMWRGKIDAGPVTLRTKE
jgi:hypothetical protein